VGGESRDDVPPSESSERRALLLGRRGPKTAWSDERLTELIREDLANSPWVGEGHRKVWARLRSKSVCTSHRRVLRLMREATLLAPHRNQRVLGPYVHDGSIIPERPNVMWGTDATCTLTLEDGQVTVFAAIDHCTAECVGIHAAKPGTRFEALEPLRQGVRARFGGIGRDVTEGLKIRHDHGSQYTSDAFQDELKFLGMESSPSFVHAPEGNGCIERFFRTLKEQLLWLKAFKNVEVRLALHAWAKQYNERWLIERHGFLTPIQARRALEAQQAMAA
jgi:transposase InsO family protein